MVAEARPKAVKFIEIGRDKKTWSQKLDPKRDLYRQMYNAVKKNGSIMSSEVDFFFDDDSDTRGTVCVGGFRQVGKFELELPMNALHIESERRTTSTRIGKIAIERIASITVHRDGYPEYVIYTTPDIEAFRNSYKRASFFWSGGAWNLVDKVGDLSGAVVRIKP